MENEEKSVATLDAEMVERFKRKFNYFTTEEVNDIHDQATYDYLLLKYPYLHLQSIPKNDYYGVRWVEMRMIEIVELDGVSSFTAYKENGLSYNIGKTIITDGLRSLIKPQAKGGN